jgi:hypothetical protein
MPTKSQGALPFLKFAMICERALVETDQVVSAIRIFDRLNTELSSSDAHLATNPATLQGDFLIGLVRGPAAKSLKVTLAITSPSGKQLGTPQTYPVEFPGDDDSGVRITVHLQIATREEGIYWFSVDVDGTELTRVPTRVAIVLKGSKT